MKTLITLLTCLLISFSASAQQQKILQPKTSVQLPHPIVSHSPTDASRPKLTAVAMPPYHPAEHPLYKTIVQMDSLYFDTYNHSKAALMDSLTADDIEFYHDRGGLITSKQELLQSIQKNIFGKVNRVLSPGSIEVYEIPNYGAIEFGYHSFRNLVEHSESRPAKFVVTWRFKDNRWQVTRVVSLH
ncbi:nuclear transport factor 2 family protein [Mucilaginibacter sp. CSA2-8R]|uniref:nuclear transport factor 2 family protein n=1 Tax=Mucilaginibacter sp. CSA2-8R TaxID=3141542 RepID=UPI00315CE289